MRSKKVGNTTSARDHQSDALPMAMFSAQMELLGAMNACAVSWMVFPLRLAANDMTMSPREEEVPAADPRREMTRLSAPPVGAWFPAAMIDGVEDTLNDQMFCPRPRDNAQQQIHTLWEQSNEFEAPGGQTDDAQDDRPQAA